MRKNNLISKRIFSIVLTIAVALTMMPTMAWADADGIAVQTVSDTQTESSVAEVAIRGGSTKYYDNIRDAFNVADVEGQTATVKLLQDVTLQAIDTGSFISRPGIELKNNSVITLDLNGFSLAQHEFNDGAVTLCSNSVIWVNKGNLTIEDSSEKKTGKIRQPNFATAVYNDEGSYLKIESGTIETTKAEGKTNTKPCALVAVGAETSIQGGTIGAEGYNGLWTRTGQGVQLSGGTYSTIEILGGSPMGSLLAEGYTFKYADDSGYPDLTQSSINQAIRMLTAIRR